MEDAENYKNGSLGGQRGQDNLTFRIRLTTVAKTGVIRDKYPKVFIKQTSQAQVAIPDVIIIIVININIIVIIIIVVVVIEQSNR